MRVRAMNASSGLKNSAGRKKTCFSGNSQTTSAGAGRDPDNMPSAPGKHYDSNQSFAGKKWTEVWAAGQGLGASKSIESVADVVNQLALEYTQAMARFQTLPYPRVVESEPAEVLRQVVG